MGVGRMGVSRFAVDFGRRVSCGRREQKKGFILFRTVEDLKGVSTGGIRL